MNGLAIKISLFLTIIYIYKRLRPRKKNPQQKKRKSRKSNFFMKLNTKPLKFKCGLANGGGGRRGAGWSTHARHGYPHLVHYKVEHDAQV